MLRAGGSLTHEPEEICVCVAPACIAKPARELADLLTQLVIDGDSFHSSGNVILNFARYGETPGCWSMRRRLCSIATTCL